VWVGDDETTLGRLVPSPKLHSHHPMSPRERSVNWTTRGALPSRGDAEKSATMVGESSRSQLPSNSGNRYLTIHLEYFMTHPVTSSSGLLDHRPPTAGGRGTSADRPDNPG